MILIPIYVLLMYFIITEYSATKLVFHDASRQNNIQVLDIYKRMNMCFDSKHKVELFHIE
jgi:hypothetical protein